MTRFKQYINYLNVVWSMIITLDQYTYIIIFCFFIMFPGIVESGRDQDEENSG